MVVVLIIRALNVIEKILNGVSKKNFEIRVTLRDLVHIAKDTLMHNLGGNNLPLTPEDDIISERFCIICKRTLRTHSTNELVQCMLALPSDDR